MNLQIKATKQYFPVVQFIKLYKGILTFEYFNENLKCDNSKESRSVHSSGTVSNCFSMLSGKDGSDFWVAWMKS